MKYKTELHCHTSEISACSRAASTAAAMAPASAPRLQPMPRWILRGTRLAEDWEDWTEKMKELIG